MNIRSIFFALVAFAALCAIPENAHAQIFVSHFGTGLANGRISVYDANTGATINPALISGLRGGPFGIAVSGDKIFVVNNQRGTIGEYTTSGQVVNRNLISGLADPIDVAVSGGKLFVTNADSDTIGEYTTSGAPVNRSLISGLFNPTNIALSGEDLFVCEEGSDTIGKYTTSGATVDSSLITGVSNGGTIAVSGERLFVASQNTVQEYTTSGALVNSSVISGADFFPIDIAVSGGNLFVMAVHFSSEPTIGKYTISGMPVNASLISGLTDSPARFTVVPPSTSVPDPSSSWMLLLLGLAAIFSLKPLLRKPA